MAMPAHVQDQEWTAERALALPEDGNRYEVLDGELFVTPSPTWGHQSVLEEIGARLGAYVSAHRLGWTRRAPADIVFSTRRLVQPDLFVVPAREDGPPRSWVEVKTLLLAVEVLSPSTARADRHRKRVIYQSEGVPEYWIIDGDARLVERWRPLDERPEIVSGDLIWQPRADLPPFRLPLEEFFSDAAS
jgi:Uma2 family endonuclease